MNAKQIVGYGVAFLHSILVWVVIGLPIVSSNIFILAGCFLVELGVVISWALFDDKCLISVFESMLLDNNIPDSFKNGRIAYFNHFIARYFSEDFVMMFHRLRPYCMMFFTGCKMLPILAVM
jgi:hypothetical protein